MCKRRLREKNKHDFCSCGQLIAVVNSAELRVHVVQTQLESLFTINVNVVFVKKLLSAHINIAIEKIIWLIERAQM
jgi:hypothetical protein